MFVVDGIVVVVVDGFKPETALGADVNAVTSFLLIIFVVVVVVVVSIVVVFVIVVIVVSVASGVGCSEGETVCDRFKMTMTKRGESDNDLYNSLRTFSDLRIFPIVFVVVVVVVVVLDYVVREFMRISVDRLCRGKSPFGGNVGMCGVKAGLNSECEPVK